MTIPKRQRLLGIAALACAGLFLADRFVVAPLLAWHRERGRLIAEMRSDIAQGERLVALRDRLSERVRDYRSREAPADPSQAEHDLLTSLRQWAGHHDVAIESIRPRRLNERDQLTQLELRVSGRGSLESMVNLLYTMEIEERPIQIRTLDLSVPRGGGGILAVALDIRLLLAQTGDLVGGDDQ